MKNRIKILAFLMTWCFLAAILRIGLIIGDDKYLQAQTGQSYSTVELAVSRGTIYDVNMKPMTNENSCYRSAVVSSPEAIIRLSELLEKTAFDDLLTLLKAGRPAVVSTGSFFSAEGAYVHRYYEYYSAGTVMAPHLIGYLDTEGVGVCGIERAFDEILRSETGIEVSFCLDARGKALAGVEPVVTGEENYNVTSGVVTTIDKTVQSIVKETASGMLGAGAVVVLDAGSGEIRASVSLPDFCVTDVGASLDRTDSPLINRSLTAYNTGSVFKLCIAAAALEKGISAQQEFTCKGYVDVGKTRYYCNNRNGHGCLDMEGALCKSCNTYFIKLAMQAGAGAVYGMAESLRFGSKTKLCDGVYALPGILPELTELLTDSGALANFSFGQGKLLTTPVQIAVMTAAIASGGLLTDASLIKGTVDKQGNTDPYSTGRTRRVFSRATAQSLTKMMTAAVVEGTGKNASVDGLSVAGKTATAETGWYVNGEEMTQAWFTGFFPAEAPRYVVTVLAEGGESGSASAAPVFAEIAERLKKKGIV